MRLAHAFIGLGLASGATISAFACSIYDSSLLLPSSAEAGTDAGADVTTIDDAGIDTGTDDAGPIRALPPDPPTSEDGTGDNDVLLATTYLRFLPSGSATVNHPHPPTSYDLDGVWTCPGKESCKPVAGQMHCDGDGGADDSAGNVFQTFAAISSTFNDDALNGHLETGQYALVFRVKGYNGGKNDKQVSFITYLSNGTDGVQDGGAKPPQNDGTDIWTIDPSALLGGSTVDGGPTCEGNDDICIPIFVDSKAYVSGGVLVAHLDFPIALGGGASTLVIQLTNTIVTAPLLFDGTTYRVEEGQIAGRWNTSKLLTSLQGVPDPVNDTDHLCGTNGSYMNIKSFICRGSDLMTDPSADGKGSPCDAISIAVSFSAVKAHLGQIFQKMPNPPPCGPNWKDDCSGVQ